MSPKRAHSESPRVSTCLNPPQLELNGESGTWTQEELDEEGLVVFDSEFICYGTVSLFRPCFLLSQIEVIDLYLLTHLAISCSWAVPQR